MSSQEFYSTLDFDETVLVSLLNEGLNLSDRGKYLSIIDKNPIVDFLWRNPNFA